MNAWHKLLEDIIQYNRSTALRTNTIFLRERESQDQAFLYSMDMSKDYYHICGDYIRGRTGNMYRMVINTSPKKGHLDDQIITPELLVRMLLEQS